MQTTKEFEKINKLIDSLNTSQLETFMAVIAWYQVHNSNNYFLDERGIGKLFIMICFQLYVKKKTKKTIKDLKTTIKRHFLFTMKKRAINNVENILEMIIDNKELYEINLMAKNTATGE